MEIWAIILDAVLAIVVGMLVFLWQRSIKENARLKQEREAANHRREEALCEGVVCILRKHLMDEHEKWMNKGYITPKALESGLSMYHAYKSLGGNGMIDHMNDDIAELPVRD